MRIPVATTLAALTALLAFTPFAHATIAVSPAAASLIDSDGDGVTDLTDNAPGTSNPSQTDLDADGIGDAIDPTPSSSNPNIADPGLHFFHPANITAGSHALLTFTLTGATPPGAFGRIELDLDSNNATDAYYFGPLDTSHTYSIDIAPSLFTSTGWNLNTPGTYTFQAKALAPGGSSNNFSTESLTVTPAPEPATLGVLALGTFLACSRRRPRTLSRPALARTISQKCG